MNKYFVATVLVSDKEKETVQVQQKEYSHCVFEETATKGLFQRYCPRGPQFIRVNFICPTPSGYIPFKTLGDVFEYTLALNFDRREINKLIESWNNIGSTQLFYKNQEVLVFFDKKPFFETKDGEFQWILDNANVCTAYRTLPKGQRQTLGKCQFNVSGQVKVEIDEFSLTTVRE
tara:strand:+ start:228 stop:752 length:525 start_codon:yes stop_codon:yes gene_type:complete